MIVDPILTGELRIPCSYAFRGQLSTSTFRAGCLAFVIRHPEAGTILVDTGLHPDAARSLRTDFGVRMGLMFRGLRPAEKPFDEQLRAVGIEPADVERVVMTHLHVDHTSGMRLLPTARFTCATREWRAATGSGAGGRGYVAHHLPAESRMDLVDFDADGEPHGSFERTIDLLGDGTIRLVSTPGHTRGHLSVLLPGEREVLLVGDAAYTRRNIDEQVLPLLTAGDRAARRSLCELKHYSDHEPDAILVPSHDPTAWKELEHEPAPV